MKSSLKLLLAAALVFGIAACGKSEEKKAEEKVAAVNTDIQRLNTLGTSLGSEGFPLGTFLTAKAPDGLSEEKVKHARDLLNEYISLGERVLASSKDKNVLFTDSSKLERNLQNARSYKSSLDGYEERARIAKEKALESQQKQTTVQTERESQTRNLRAIGDGLKTIVEIDKRVTALREEIFLTWNIHLLKNPAQQFGADRWTNQKMIAKGETGALASAAGKIAEVISLLEQEMNLAKDLPSHPEMNASVAKVRTDLEKEHEIAVKNLNAVKSELKKRDASATEDLNPARTNEQPSSVNEGGDQPIGGRMNPGAN